VARNAARRERFTCGYEEFSIDTALGRVLRATCRALMDRVALGTTREALGRCLALLDDVSDVPDGRVWLDRVVLDRRSERFADLLAFCRLVLEQQAPTSRSGAATTFSLLFDMDRVFEGFVAGFLRGKVMPRFEELQLRVQGQGARAPLLRTERDHGALYLKPDLLLTTRGTREAQAVLDTKWKRLGAMTQRKQAGLGAADLYQMFAYTRRYGVARSVLLFPWITGSVERDFHVMGPGDIKEGSQISVRFVDLRRSLRRAADRDALAEDLGLVLRRTLMAA
jgi:5-methylcytosine-specific restriction enzyme subunit McrC